MDALALLCNLHGDGPATLAGLRELGVRELPDLQDLDQGALTRLLGGVPTAADRFRREGRLLHERLEGPLPEPTQLVPEQPRAVRPEPEPAPEEPAEPQVEEARQQAPEPTADLVPRPPAAASAPEPSPSTAPADHDPVVHAVLGLWSHLDRGASAPVASGCTLAESELDALRPDEVVLLAQAGIRTLDELAACDALAVSRQVEIPFTHLSHLRFLAKKRLREGGALPAEEPARSGEDPGGPFA